MNQANFLSNIKNLVTGGGRDSSGNAKPGAGFLRTMPYLLSQVDINTTRVVDTSDGGSATDPVIESGAYLAADETNARVIKVDAATDTVFRLAFPIPSDYDEATDHFKVRVLASQATVSTDNDVELDATCYVKTAGSALGSDLNPTAPGTVLSTTEQWIEIDLGGNSLQYQDVAHFTLITNGANDTASEEVLIHAIEVEYRSCLVSYFDETSAGVALR